MITYICPLCGTEGISMDDEKKRCPYCDNHIREGRPEISFRIKRIGQPEKIAKKELQIQWDVE